VVWVIGGDPVLAEIAPPTSSKGWWPAGSRRGPQYRGGRV